KPKWELCGSFSKLKDVEAYLEDFIDCHFDSAEAILSVESGTWESTYGDNKQKLVKGSGEYRLYSFNPNHEEDDIEPVLASILPLIKACSLLPHTPNGVYKQMPEEGISEEEYLRLKSSIRPIDWSTFSGSDGEDETYCQGGACEIPW